MSIAGRLNRCVDQGLQAFAHLHSCICLLREGCCPARVQSQTLMQLVQEVTRGLHACSPVHLPCDMLHHCACMLQPMHLPCHVLSGSRKGVLHSISSTECLQKYSQIQSVYGQNTST